MILNIVFDGPRRGDINMALDWLLLERAAETGEAYARLYTWTPTTLSLGRRQWDEKIVENAARLGIPVVRRPTGGAALIHSESLEVTYSIALPRESSLYEMSIAESASAIIQAIAWGLRRLGLPVKGGTPDRVISPSERPSLCLHAPGAGDLLSEDGRLKLGGSAQYRSSRGLLQHGQILVGLERSLWERVFGVKLEGVSSLEEISGRNLALEDIAYAVAVGLAGLPGVEAVRTSGLPEDLSWRSLSIAGRYRVSER